MATEVIETPGGVPFAGFATRFWEKVRKQPVGCWEWTGAKTGGYGLIKMAKGRQRGQFQGGERHPGAKLTRKAVVEIKRGICLGERVFRIARAFGVSEPTVSNIKHRRYWRQVGAA
jgi:hypothetical protein